MRVAVHDLTHHFGAQPVLRRVSLEVADRELFFLLGPSGCGKTTLLRLLAGFYQPDQGEIRFGDRRMNGIEPHHRNTGMVFQNYALWPHLSVAENVSYGLDVRSVAPAEKRARTLDALRTVRMEEFADRSPNQLSGGQQQRVALARALVIRPDVLLLDEPLSNLDARLRLEMRDEIRRIHDETRITTIYVTHDQKEALSMADRLAVLRDGVVEQLGPPRDVYRRPANRFVAEFIGEANWLAGTIATASPTGWEVRSAIGTLHIHCPPAPAGTPTPTPLPTPTRFSPGQSVRVGFRPETIRFVSPTSPPAGTPNLVAAQVRQVTYLGEIEQCELTLPDGTPIKAFEADPESSRTRGDQVLLSLPPASLFVLPE